MKRHLRSTFSDVITDCYMCRDIVIKGELCDEKKMHHHCARRYVQTQSKSHDRLLMAYYLVLVFHFRQGLVFLGVDEKGSKFFNGTPLNLVRLIK